MVDAASASESEEHNSARGDGSDRKERSRPRAKSPNGTERIIDPVALAGMLREAADFVEKNEFDPMLYQTVQDFRAYYKHHQPKKQNSRRRRKKSGSHNTGDVSADEDNVESRETSEMNGDGPTSHASGSAPERPTGSTSWAYSATPDAQPTSRSEDMVRPDPPAIETAIPLHTSPGPTPIATVGAKLGREMSSPSAVAHPSPSAIAKTAAAAVFGNLKFPKIPVPNPAFAATSKKNAQRVKTDLEEAAAAAAAGIPPQAESSARRKSAYPEPSSTSMPPSQNGHEGDWCEKHFTMGCACKTRNFADIGTDGKPTSQRSVHQHAGTNGAPPSSSSTVNITARPDDQEELPFDEAPRTTTATASANAGASSTATHQKPTPSESPAMSATVQQPHKPPYQRPINPNSTLIANGWIEQQRRSKMRTVWKDVLASLVAGRKPGEETTLWIQREVTNAVTGKKELEALHQVPIKWLQDVTHMDYATDNRFSLRVYNIQEEYLFRCSTDQAAKNWVQTLRNAQEAVQGTRQNLTKTKLDGWDSAHPTSEASSFNDEKKGNEPQAYPSQPRHPQPQSDAAPKQDAELPQQPAPTQQRMTVRDLRAICHGAGINTMGMERPELEAAAAEVRARGTYFAGPTPGPVPTASAPTNDDARSRQEELRRKEQDEIRSRQEELRRRQEMEAAEELRRREEEALEMKRQQQLQEETRRRVEEDRRRKEEERRRLEEETRRRVEEERQKAEEEARRRQAEEELRRRHAEEEHRRRVAEQERLKQLAEEQRRQQEEALRAQQQQWQQHQQQWQKQQQEEQERRRRAEVEQQQAAEQRRRQQEAFRQWQQQQRQQQHHHPAQQQNWHQGQQQPHQQQPHQQQNWHQQQQHQQQQQQQWQQQQQQGHSAASEKYAQMANQRDDGQATTTRIKHDILIHWALQPPQLQMLRPIDALVTSIHTVFPPALGVPGHEYFTKWTPFTRNELVDDNGRPDDGKLKKAVRKLRFFLHPDKLPRDLSAEQKFMVKMLWDVTNDAWEEFHKRAEDLDWLNK